MDYLADRSWMDRRKVGPQIYASLEFRNGVKAFVEYAYSHRECVQNDGRIRCPCSVCKNKKSRDKDAVIFHIVKSGFMNNYRECWWAHGERRVSCTDKVQNSGDSSTYRMTDMVQDIAGPEFDIDERADEVINNDAKAFMKLLAEGRESLWDGCKNHSILSAVATLLNIKVDHNISNECFEAILKEVKTLLPECEKLPNNFYHAKKMLKKLGLGYQKIDACPNDCMLYYKENEQRMKCKECGHDRYRPRKDGVTTKKKLVPYKVLRYFPITPRLQRMYMSSRTAEHMTWHAKSPAKDGELNHPADGQAWKEVNSAYPDFASEPRNVRLGLSTDGFNPFGHSTVPYSCWPVFLTPYNLPP